MISSHEIGGRTVWAVDRANKTDKVYAEDQPPAVTLAGAIALLLVPVAVIGLTAPYTALQAIGAVAAATLLTLAVIAGLLMRKAEKRWLAGIR